MSTERAPVSPGTTFAALGEMYDALARVIRRGGRTYPAAIEALHGRDLSRLLRSGDDCAPVDARLRAAGEAHLQGIAARSSALHDGPIAVLEAIEDGVVTTARSRYFAMLATCDSLHVEYLEASGRRASLGDLPRRRLVHEAAGGDPLRTGRGRAAAVGVSVAVTVPRGSSRALLLGRRNRRLAADPGLWHVAPSGMLEPVVAGGRPLIPTVATELREELGVVLSGTDELAARLRVLGIGYDLLRLRPEVCLRLDLELGEPVAETSTLLDGELDEIELVELSAAGLAHLWTSRPPGSIAPAAAATVALLEAELEKRASLPTRPSARCS